MNATSSHIQLDIRFGRLGDLRRRLTIELGRACACGLLPARVEMHRFGYRRFGQFGHYLLSVDDVATADVLSAWGEMTLDKIAPALWLRQSPLVDEAASWNPTPEVLCKLATSNTLAFLSDHKAPALARTISQVARALDDIPAGALKQALPILFAQILYAGKIPPRADALVRSGTRPLVVARMTESLGRLRQMDLLPRAELLDQQANSVVVAFRQILFSNGAAHDQLAQRPLSVARFIANVLSFTPTEADYLLLIGAEALKEKHVLSVCNS